MVVCCVCQAESQDINLLEIHIATAHAQYLAYECEICDFSKFPSDYALRKHYVNVHQKENFKISYVVTPELEQKRLEVKNLIAQSLTLESTNKLPFSSPTLFPPKKLISTSPPDSDLRFIKNRTIGPQKRKRPKEYNMNGPIKPINIEVSTKSVDSNQESSGQHLVEIEAILSSKKGSEMPKNEDVIVLNIKPQEASNSKDTENGQKSDPNVASKNEQEEGPSWSHLFSENIEENINVVSKMSLAQTGYKYTENGKCYTAYDKEFEKDFPWIQESKRGDRFFFCKVCRKDVCLGVSGTMGPKRLIQQHYDTIKHKQLSELAKKSDDAVYKALNPKSWGRFRSKFTKMFPELKPSDRGECYFFCTICEKDLVFAQGIRSVTAHLETTRHLNNAQKKGTTVNHQMDKTTPQEQLEILASQDPLDGDINGDPISQDLSQQFNSSSLQVSFQDPPSTSTTPWVKIEPVLYGVKTVEDQPGFDLMDASLCSSEIPDQPESSDVYLKRPMSAYFKWALEWRPKLKEEYPEMSNTAISKKLGEIWKAMSEEEKQPYFDQMRALWDKFPNWLFKPKLPRGAKPRRGKRAPNIPNQPRPKCKRMTKKKPADVPFTSPSTEVSEISFDHSNIKMEFIENPEESQDYQAPEESQYLQKPGDYQEVKEYQGYQGVEEPFPNIIIKQEQSDAFE